MVRRRRAWYASRVGARNGADEAARGLAARDVRPGCVAYFVVRDLRRDPAIARAGGSRDTSPRPFVCFAVDDAAGTSSWAPLTTQPGRGRLRILAAWLEGARGSLAERAQFLHGGGHTYVGPTARFVAHAAGVDGCRRGGRPALSAEGLEAVRLAVELALRLR